MLKDLAYYKNLLPKNITVKTRITEEGLVAEVKEFPHCYTQASNQTELIEMVNDAIFTYLEIPEEFAKNLGVIYLPEKVAEELKRMKMQEFCNEIMKGVSATTTSYQRVAVS